MINIDEIRKLHIEFSGNCNARCVCCPRNVGGYNINTGFAETDLSYNLIKNRITPNFIKQLFNIHINGNYGDFLLNDESLDIIEYFRNNSDKLDISISTNGSARNEDWWKKLAELNTQVYFSLDGLSDTHSLYRQDTSWEKIIENAKTFIKYGGYAIWKIIPFEHNNHQIEECAKMAYDLGFKKVDLTDHSRNRGPIYNKKTGNFEKTLELNSQNWPDTAIKYHEQRQIKALNYLKNSSGSGRPSCVTKKNKTIYISADAKVFPCCWTGLTTLKMYSEQIKPLIDKNINDLNYYTLEECIKWFEKIEDSWNKTYYRDGRMYICDDICNNNEFRFKKKSISSQSEA